MNVPVHHHAHMLSDHERLNQYSKAISTLIKPGETVIDIGTGLGILSLIAASIPSIQIIGIEYFQEVADAAKKICHHKKNIKIMQGRSYDLSFDNVNAIITETIGAVGPEENIVELMYDFKKRHPQITTLIPQKLTLYAQPIYSEIISDQFTSVLNSIKSASKYDMAYQDIDSLIDEYFSSNIYQNILSDSKPVSVPTALITYQLGKTATADFNIKIKINTNNLWNGVNIFFKAELANNVFLTNAINAPLTHWQHSFIKRQGNRRQLTISYNSENCSFNICWL